MSVVRVVKDSNFITMGKYHLKEKDMSLKAIGLLSIMLSLPDDWDYSVNGLNAIRKESRNTINEILKELENFGYLNRTRIRDEKGKIIDVEYTIFESPYLKNQDMENQDIDNQDIDNCIQLNNKELNNKIIKESNNKEIYKERFKKPTLEEVKAYCEKRKNGINPKKFIDYYEANGWVQGKSRKPIKDWKACVRTWEQQGTLYGITPKSIVFEETTPAWFNQTIVNDNTADDEWNNILDSFS